MFMYLSLITFPQFLISMQPKYTKSSAKYYMSMKSLVLDTKNCTFSKPWISTLTLYPCPLPLYQVLRVGVGVHFFRQRAHTSQYWYQKVVVSKRNAEGEKIKLVPYGSVPSFCTPPLYGWLTFCTNHISGKILVFENQGKKGPKKGKNRVFGLLRKIESLLVFARNDLK